MKKLLLLLAGVAIGYFVGFADARGNDETIVVRMVDRVGGDHRENMITDVDRQMDEAER